MHIWIMDSTFQTFFSHLNISFFSCANRRGQDRSLDGEGGRKISGLGDRLSEVVQQRRIWDLIWPWSARSHRVCVIWQFGEAVVFGEYLITLKHLSRVVYRWSYLTNIPEYFDEEMKKEVSPLKGSLYLFFSFIRKRGGVLISSSLQAFGHVVSL